MALWFSVLLWTAAISMACWMVVDYRRQCKRINGMRDLDARVIEQCKLLAFEQKAHIAKLNQIIEVYKERERILLWEPLTGSTKPEVKH